MSLILVNALLYLKKYPRNMQIKLIELREDCFMILNQFGMLILLVHIIY